MADIFINLPPILYSLPNYLPTDKNLYASVEASTDLENNHLLM